MTASNAPECLGAAVFNAASFAPQKPATALFSLLRDYTPPPRLTSILSPFKRRAMVAALFALAIFASGVFSQTILNVATITGDSTEITANTILTGSASGKKIKIREGVTVTFRNLSVVGTTREAVSIVDNGNNIVTINLEGSNSLVGGIGGAALRVPTNTSVTINGPGTLTAIGGQWRSLIGTDAGAGIGGGYAFNISGTNNSNLTDACGTVTINGGTIYAYGGGSGESGTSNNGRCSYAAGIGGSGRAGTGCNLTINGGNITAVGGRSGINDIGPGWGANAATCDPTSGTAGTNGTTNITGGSVNAVILGTVTNGSNTVTKQTFTIGTNNKDATAETAVKGCGFATPSITCDQAAPPASSKYGINDVKTDIDSKVYFWLSGYSSGSTTDSIVLSPNDAFKHTTNQNFLGPIPTLSVPDYIQNVDGGAYTTGFPVQGGEYRAAVDHDIIFNKGIYTRNDADEEAKGTSASNGRVHPVKWYRITPKTQESGYDTTYIAGKDGFVSANENFGTTTYIPVAADYGNRVFAKVLPMDNKTAGRPANTDDENWASAVSYPAVQIGAVVKVKVVGGAGFDGEGDIENAGASATVTRLGQQVALASYNDNKWTLDSNLVTIDVPYSLSVWAGVGEGVDAKYTWKATSESKDITGKLFSSTEAQNPTFTMPSGIGEEIVGGDITLTVTIKDATTPKLLSIKIGDGDFVDVDNYYAYISGTIPKSGTIVFAFSRPIENFEEPYSGFNVGTLTSESGEINALYSSASTTRDTLTYTYSGLIPGSTYPFRVAGFVNAVPNEMMPVTTNSIKVEQKPILTISPDKDNEYIVARVLTDTLKYTPNQGGNLTGIEYYWEVSDSAYINTSAGVVDFDEYKSGSSIIGSSSSAASGVLTTLQSPELPADAFGKYIRLVVRPIGTNPVDGTTKGAAAFGLWQKVGVLLAPGAPSGNSTANSCDGDYVLGVDGECHSTFTKAINFRGCDFSNVNVSLAGCTEKGLIIYDTNTIQLWATPEPYIETQKDVYTYYKVGGWKDDEKEPNSCETADGPFTCIASNYFYKIKMSAIPTDGEITITPQVVEIRAPEISSATLNVITNAAGSSSSSDLVAAVEDEDSVQVIGNTLTITFTQAVTYRTSGLIKLVKGTAELTLWDSKNTDYSSWNGSEKTSDKFTKALDFENALFDGKGNNFNSRFKIKASGFTSASGDVMDAEEFNFSTADAPSVGKPTLTTSNLPSATFAVGHQITSSEITYIQNGAAAAGTHTYQWQRSDSQSGSGTDIIGASASSYTPGADDFNKYIRLKITPKDVDSREGAPVYSDWVRVGVLVKAGAVTLDGAWKRAAIAIGTKDTSASREVGDVIYNEVAVRLVDSVLTDTLTALSASSGGTFNPENITPSTFTPNAPESDITFTASVRDGSKPTIAVIKNGNTSFDFTFSKEVISTDAGAKITIVQETGEGTGNEWVYTVVPSTLGSSSSSLSLALGSFKNASSSSFVDGADRYLLKIEAGAFTDSRENLTEANERLITFSQNKYFVVDPKPRSITQSVIYGSYAIGAINTPIAVTNKSSVAVNLRSTVKGTGTEGVHFGVSASSAGSVSSGSEQSFNITISNLKLDVGTYTDTLLIEIYDTSSDSKSEGEERVVITLIVAPKVLTVDGSPTLALPSGSSSKVYDGTTAAPPLESWTWSSSGQAVNDDNVPSDVTIKAYSGNFGDAGVGINKPITSYYQIEGTKAKNYTFTEGIINPILNNSTLSGSITPKPISITVNTHLGEKVYDGGESFTPNEDKYYLTEGGVLGEDDVSLDRVNALFYFANSNVEVENGKVADKAINRVSISLTGVGAGNYTLIAPELTNVKGKITPAPLSGLANSDSTGFKNEGSSDLYELRASATYGDSIKNASSWKQGSGAPASSGNVEKNGQPLAGYWQITAASGIVSPVNQEQLYARFIPTSANYLNDLVLRLNLTVDKKPLTIAADLSDAGDLRNGRKTYDRTETLENVKALGNNEGLVGSDNLSGVTATATFADADAGENKPLTVVWDLGNGDIAEKYTAANTISQGHINPRTATLTGIIFPAKVYDGSTAVEGDIITTDAVLTDTIFADGIGISPSSSVIAKFASANVNWDETGKKEDSVDVVISSGFTLTGEKSGNYILPVVNAKSVILQKDLGDIPINNSITLRNSGIYGDELGDVFIRTGAPIELGTNGNNEEGRFPNRLSGVVLPGATTPEKVQGTWDWSNLDELIGSATVSNACPPLVPLTEGVNEYATEKSVVFTPQNDNYKEFTATAKVCVSPKQLVLGAPSGFTEKVYDGTREVDKSKLTINATAPSFVRTDGQNLLVLIDTAYYNDSSAGTRDITVKYKIKDNSGTNLAANYFAPVNFVQGSMTIKKRPLTVVGLVPQGREYKEGDVSATVLYSEAALQPASNDSGVVAVDVGRVSLIVSDIEPEFEFYAGENAGEDKEIRLSKGNIGINGDVASNYAFALPLLTATISKASFASAACHFLADNCDALTSDGKNDLLDANLSKAIDSIMALKGRAGEPILAIYGQRFSEFNDSLSAVLPSKLNDIFGGLNSAGGTWSWETATGGSYVGDAGKVDTGYAQFLHSSGNYEVLSGIPVPVSVGKRALTATVTTINKDYDTSAVIHLNVSEGNVAANDAAAAVNVKLSITGTALDEDGAEDANAGNGKQVLVTAGDIKWAAGVTDLVKNNYTLPASVLPEELEVNIAKIHWPGDVPELVPTVFVFDTIRYPNLSTIGLPEGWAWAVPSDRPASPNVAANNPSDAVFITRQYDVVYAPPDTTNYIGKPGTAELVIYKRSEDSDLDFALTSSTCGSNVVNVTVKAADTAAAVWFGGSQYNDVGTENAALGIGDAYWSPNWTNKGTFTVSGDAAVAYGTNTYHYEIQAQAYGDEFRTRYGIDFVRNIPFAKVAAAIRGKAMTVTFDSSQTAEQNLFRKHTFTSFKWYKNDVLVGEGRNLPLAQTDLDSAEYNNYSVVLRAADGFEIASCKLSGADPDVVPNLPFAPSLAASPFGSQLARGGSKLILNTPNGGAISIFTLKGELVSRANAVESRSVVDVPSTNGIYIVKFEAK